MSESHAAGDRRRAPDHAADAGGDAAALAAKQTLREEVWDVLEAEGLARFPGARGRIPNFAGAADAAERLRRQPLWRDTEVVKANPDAPQWPVRQRALADDIVLYMAVPRLAEPDPFVRLDPAAIDEAPRTATSIKGAQRQGQPVAVSDLEPVDLVVMGCVAVEPGGARLGKGGGFADLEFALAREAGLIDDRTVVATTVHPRQIVETGRIPVTGHDVPVDLVVTADDARWCDRAHPRPAGVRWKELTDEKIAAIPLLSRLRTDP